MIIDATDLILGRLAATAAKKALQGEEIMVVNCEKTIVTGNKAEIIDNYRRNIHFTIPLKGPYYPRNCDRIVRRTIRGMIPYKKPRGIEAFKKVRCYIGIPAELKDKKIETIKEANVGKLPNTKYIYLSTISKQIGGKQ